MTRKLNFAVSRLPFHEMRLRANRALTEQIKEGMTSTDEGVKDRGREDVWVASIQNASHRLRTRLRRLEIESKALLLECESEMKIAQSQLQIVRFPLLPPSLNQPVVIRNIHEASNEAETDTQIRSTTSLLSMTARETSLHQGSLSPSQNQWRCALSLQNLRHRGFPR